MKPIKEIELEKVYSAPLEKVWKAWTDPKMIKKWWGPDNVTAPECEIDLHVGGRIYIVMEAGEGMGEYKGLRWPMLGKFTIVEPNSKLSYTANAWTEGQKEETMIDQRTDVVMTEVGGKTIVNVRAAIYKTGPKAGMAAEGMEYGFTQQLEKLKKFLLSNK